MANQKITGDLTVEGQIILPALYNAQSGIRKTSGSGNRTFYGTNNSSSSDSFTWRNAYDQPMLFVCQMQLFDANITVKYTYAKGTEETVMVVDYLTNKERTVIMFPIIVQPGCSVSFSGASGDNYGAKYRYFAQRII